MRVAATHPEPDTVAGYLLSRLKELGVDHLFAVPGDFVLGFLNEALRSEVACVGTCNELNAAYAADGYARLRGLGAFATTFGVGELSALNGVAGAFAEGVPVVAITGTPSLGSFRKGTLLHHTLGDYRIPFRMFEKVTAAAAHLEDGGCSPRASAASSRCTSACLRTSCGCGASAPARSRSRQAPLRTPRSSRRRSGRRRPCSRPRGCRWSSPTPR